MNAFFHNARTLFATAILCLLGVSGLAHATNTDGCMIRVQYTEQTASNDQPAAPPSLYTRLGGYDAIAAVVDDLVQRLAADKTLGRFWAHRGADGIKREKQLVVNFIVDRAGGPLYYGGRDMVTAHKGMRISDGDWKIFMGHLQATLDKFKVPAKEQTDVVAFMESLKATMVEQ